MSDTVHLKIEDGVAAITLNRPDRLNALDSEMMDYLPEVVRAVADNPLARCVVLTGAGRGFCAGGDLRSRQEELESAVSLPEEERKLREMPYIIDGLLKARVESARLLHEMSKPVIAMINGPCAGAGLSLAGACDLRFASQSAVFTSAFTRAGLSGDFGGTWFWTQILGTAKARELYLLSERMDAQAALRMGLINRIYPDADLLEQTMSVARSLAEGPSWSFAYAKRNLNAALDSSLDRVLQSEATTMGLASRTAREAGHLPVSILNRSQ